MPFPRLAASSGIREDSSNFALGSVAGPRWAQAAVVQLRGGVVCDAHSTSPFCPISLTQGNFTHPSSTMFNLHAWTLLGTGINDRDSLRVLPDSWLNPYGLQRVLSMTKSGTFSVLAVADFYLGAVGDAE